MLDYLQAEPSQRPAVEHPTNHRSDRMPPGPAKTVVQNLRVVSETGRCSVPSGVPNVREERGSMRPARQKKKFMKKLEWTSMIKNNLAGRVAVDATLPVVLARDVAVGMTSLVDFVGCGVFGRC